MWKLVRAGQGERVDVMVVDVVRKDLVVVEVDVVRKDSVVEEVFVEMGQVAAAAEVSDQAAVVIIQAAVAEIMADSVRVAMVLAADQATVVPVGGDVALVADPATVALEAVVVVVVFAMVAQEVDASDHGLQDQDFKCLISI